MKGVVIKTVDKRTLRSKTALKKAFLELLEEYPVKKISIGDILERSGYSNPTFYNYYQSKDDFIEKIMTEALEALDYVIQTYQSNHKNVFADIHNIQLFREHIFEHIYQERTMYHSFFTQPCFARFHRKLLNFMMSKPNLPVFYFNFATQEHERYFNYISCYIFVGTVRFWVEENFATSPAKVGYIYANAFCSANTKMPTEKNTLSPA